ncbi:MAG TPA: PDDEXK nuclease domain-containing protein [Bacteroidia bacterium]|jgi:predicted nuclease of restriction endonuclease-like (RecB) superfamily|nr:PDDEXK nuclease domain-containing protein [Bacteroidia bacterium]
MVNAYWEVGRVLFEVEQKGKERADYGSYVISELSKRLTATYGRGFDESNLRYMRLFYKNFPIGDALRHQLSWTHFRFLLKVESKEARLFYMQEAFEGNWSTRTLERQINSHYYERMLITTKEKRPLVKMETARKKELHDVNNIIKDPYVLEFLDLKSKTGFYEKEIEQGLIDKLQEFLLELGKGFSFVGGNTESATKNSIFTLTLYFIITS